MVDTHAMHMKKKKNFIDMTCIPRESVSETFVSVIRIVVWPQRRGIEN
jgi:hypothetical protein